MIRVAESQGTWLRIRLKGRGPLRELFGFWRSHYRRMLLSISPVLLARHRFHLKTGHGLHLRQPRTFDEKLMWLMLFWRHPLKTQCADKYGVRAYAADLGYGDLLVDLLGVYERPEDIDFALLPERFVLKATHGCGFNLICRDKANLDFEEARKLLRRWLEADFYRVHGEVQYAGITPRIICERFLDDGTGALPSDYKMHCFHGKVLFTTVCTGRGPDGEGAAYDHFDRDWATQLAISKSGVHPERWRPQPACYPEMLEAAEALSKPFPYVRMDFYAVGPKAVLGEMTFTPAGCIDTGYTDEAQRMMGDLIHLPERL